LDYVEIQIRDFTKLVKRSREITHPQWFAMPNDILLHPDFMVITGAEFKAYIWICGVASKLNQDKIRVYPDLCARQVNITKNDVLRCIEKLEEKRWDRVACVSRDTQETHESHTTRQDKTRQDKTKYKLLSAVAKLAPPENSPDELLNSIPLETRSRWVALYQDELFLKRELIKAHGYYVTDNPAKCPKSVKGWQRALSMWFERAWTWQAKNTKGKPKEVTTEDILKSLEDNPNDVA
jgi:hypothetical protein